MLTIPEANDTGTDNVEATDTDAETDIEDADSNAADDADADNSDASTNNKDGVSDDIYYNDYGTDTNNSDIDDTDNTYYQHDPLLCLVWSSVALLNLFWCTKIL